MFFISYTSVPTVHQYHLCYTL